MQEVLEQKSATSARVFVIWQPMLPTDWTSPGRSALRRVRDVRARQYWDKQHLVARDFKKQLDQDDAHPQPECCEKAGVPWDLIAVYPPGVRWEAGLPRAAYADGPVFLKKEAFRQALTPANP